MERIFLLAVSVAGAVWCWRRMTSRNPVRVVLLAFWGLLGVNQLLKWQGLTVAAAVCLALAVGLAVLRWVLTRQGLKKIQREAGLSDAEMASRVKAAKGLLADEERKKETPRKEAAREGAYAAKARGGRFALELTLPKEHSLSTAGGGWLNFGPGLVKAEVEMEGYDLGDNIRGFQCRTLVCDGDGTEWRAETLGRAGAWLGPLEEPEGTEFVRWENARAAWQKAMKEDCLLAGATELMDSREYRELVIEGRKYGYMEKYQGPTVDVAWLALEKRWLVRVKGIFRDHREDPPAAVEDDTIPPFAFTVPAETGSLLAEPHWHACLPDEVWEEEEDRVVKPTFERSGEKGAGQGTVVAREG